MSAVLPISGSTPGCKRARLDGGAGSGQDDMQLRDMPGNSPYFYIVFEDDICACSCLLQVCCVVCVPVSYGPCVSLASSLCLPML